MGLLAGSVSLTRFAVAAAPDEPEFEALGFTPLLAGSEHPESAGFLPFENDAPYRVGERRHAFRIRVDRLRPDTNAVAERLRELTHAELAATGLRFLGRARRRELADLAAEEVARRSAPRVQVVEGCLDAGTLYLATAAKSLLGTCLHLLRGVGIAADPKAPWLDDAMDEPPHPFFEVKQPGESVWGCRFLRALVEEGEVLVEPIAGSVRLQTHEARVSLLGAVLPELARYLDGEAELLAARLLAGEFRFRLEASTFRVHALSFDGEPLTPWTEQLDARIEKIGALFELLDGEFRRLAPNFATPRETPAGGGPEGG